MPSHKTHDITIRLRRKDRRRITREEARAALWAAQEIARRGGDVEAEMRDFDIEAIDWRHTYRSGRQKTYRYVRGGSPPVSEVLVSIVGILREVDMNALRVEPIEGGE